MPLILNGDGSLSGTSLQVDSPTFVVDHSNNRVGVGTSTPSHPLHVSGSISVSAVNGSKIGYNIEDTFSSNSTTGAHYGITFGVPSNNRVSLSGWDGVDVWTGGSSRLSIDGLGRIITPNQPIFMSYGASGSSGTSGVDWIFPNTYVNIGNHYNTSNGRFTAPVAGRYMFFWSNIGNTSNTVYRYRIRKNGVNFDDYHLRLAESSSGYRDNGDRMIILSAAAGDYFNIHYVSDNGTSSYIGEQYPSFGGYLLG